MSQSAAASIWMPLRQPLFRGMWIGICLSNLGYWMQNIGAAWMMRIWTDGDAILVGLVQTALFLPTVFLIVPAGTLADIFDRRRILIFANLAMMVIAAALAVLIATGVTDPWVLLILLALYSTGFALNQPTQSAVVPEIVGLAQVPKAVSLYSLANNGARVLGPGLAGALIPLIGGASIIIINALSFLPLLFVLAFWKRERRIADTSGGGFLIKLRSAFAYAAATPSYRAVLIRGGLFFIVASTVLALTPLLVPEATSYGIVFGCFGLGAVVGGLNYGWIAARYARPHIVFAAIVTHAICLILLGLASSPWILAPVMLITGSAWFFVMSALQISAQLILPDSVRGRGMAMLNMVLMLGYAAGSPLWGVVANRTGADTAIMIAAAASLTFLALTYRLPMPADPKAD